MLSDIGAIALGIGAAWAAARARARPPHVRLPPRRDLRRAGERRRCSSRSRCCVFVEAISRLSDAPDVDGAGRRGRRRLRPDRKRASPPSSLRAATATDLNLEGVLRHSAADALGSLGALVAGRRDRGRRPARGGRGRRSPDRLPDPARLVAAHPRPARRAARVGAARDRRRGGRRRDGARRRACARSTTSTSGRSRRASPRSRPTSEPTLTRIADAVRARGRGGPARAVRHHAHDAPDDVGAAAVYRGPASRS